MNDPAQRKPAVWNTEPLAHVKKIIAVASGKGGVGKSTVTVQLAYAFASQGLRAGILDADIYGPSIPRMLGLSGQPEFKDAKMQPLVAHNISCMSMGFLSDQAAILRAPMITKTLQQMLRLTQWGTADAPLDFLLVDMPPGTGDIHLSMAQQVPLSGAIIVTTPQAVAVDDARKCAVMFQKLRVPLLGIVENMSYFQDISGNRHALFGEGGGKALADELGALLLGQIPLDPQLGIAGDQGSAYGNCDFLIANLL